MKKSKYFEKQTKVEVEDRQILGRLTALRDDLRKAMGVIMDDMRRVSMRPCSVDEDASRKAYMMVDTMQALRGLEAGIELRSKVFDLGGDGGGVTVAGSSVTR